MNDTEDQQPAPPEPGRGRPFRRSATVVCLVAWVLIVAANRLAQLAVHPAANFERPVEALVRSTEGPLSLGQAFERESGEALGGALSLAGEAARVARTYDEVRSRLTIAEAEGELSIEPESLVQLRVRAATLRASEGQRPALFQAEDFEPLASSAPLVEAAAVAFDGRSTERGPALIDAALELYPGPARTALLEALGERLGSTERTAPAIDAERARDAARLRSGLGLLAGMSILGLLGLSALGALVFLPARRVRLDPPDRPQRWPDLPDGLGLFARYGVAFFLVQTGLALTVGSSALGLTGLVSSAPLLLFAAFRYGGLGRGLVPLGGGLARDRLGRLLLLPLGAWVVALLGLAAVVTALSDRTPDPFANPFLDLIAREDGGMRGRLLLEACLWAPLFEELAFRAALFGGLRSRLPFVPAALVSSLVFGVAHAYDAAGVAGIVWVGFALAALYERTRSIWACVLAHALFNFGQLQIAFTVIG